MTTPRTTIIAVVTALAFTGAAQAADAPVVSEQGFHAGTAPITIPGTGLKKGEQIGFTSRLVFCDVTLEGHQKARVILRAPKGKRVRGIGVEGGRSIAIKADAGYVGKRRVVVTATRTSADGRREATSRIYALTK